MIGFPSKASLIQWATSASYPISSDPWSGTPTKVQPGTLYNVPGTDAVAEFQNWAHNQETQYLDGVLGALASVPLTFQALVTTLGISMTSACYDDHGAAWVVMGDGAFDQVARSVDNGRTWVAGSTSSGITFESGAFDNSGNAVFPSSTTGINDYTASTGLYAKHSGVFTGGVSGPQVVWSQTAALWCVMYRNASSGFQCFTSANRTSWTSRTAGLPAAFTGYTGSSNPVLGARDGAIIAGFYGAGAWTFATSTDGGVTWTAGAFGSALPNATNPVYDPNDAAWYLAAYNASTHVTEIWTSLNDGSTWTLQYTRTSGGICQGALANVGSLLLTQDNDTLPGVLFYSVDKGLSWRRATAHPGTTLWSGGGGFLTLDSSGKTSANSVRIGAFGRSI